MRSLLAFAISSLAVLQAPAARADEAPPRADDTAASSAAPAQQQTAPLPPLDERISELEAQNLLNHFHLGGYFVFRFDDITYRPNNDPSKDNHVAPISLRFALNVDADISDDLKFYSTLGMAKFGNAAFTANGALAANQLTADLFGSYTRTTSALFVDRAYLDYHLRSLPLVLSVGRLPSIEGPPANLWDGEPRSGTYPLMCFNTIMDGIALTVILDKLLPEGHILSLRGVWSPLGQLDVARPYAQVSSGGTLYDTMPPNGSLMLEWGMKPRTFADSVDLILEYESTGNVRISPSILVPDSPVPLAGDLGSRMQDITAHLELGDIGHLGLDLAASYTESITDLSGTMVVAGTDIPVAVGTGKTYGGGALVSLRYRLPIPQLNRPYVGAEYYYATKNFALFTTANEDLTNFYMNPGRAFHLYYTQPITQGLTLRVGFRRQNLIAASPNIAVAGLVETQDRFLTWYANLRLDL